MSRRAEMRRAAREASRPRPARELIIETDPGCDDPQHVVGVQRIILAFTENIDGVGHLLVCGCIATPRLVESLDEWMMRQRAREHGG